jgi:predicted dehydrogenase
MEQVRVGIIGTGGMAQGHIRNLLQNPEASVTALCDIRDEALTRTVERFPGLADAPQFADYREMIDSGLVDAVQIVTPHTTHYEQIMTSLDRGMHVLCEKPMTCSVEHAHNVLGKIEETGKVFVLGYQRHYQPEFLYIRDAIASGKFGKVEFVQGLQCQGWLKGCAGTWRHDPALSGGGQLNDSGSHLLAVLLFSTGLTVDRVAAFMENFHVPVDINSALTLEFVGGAQGNISIVGNAPTWHEDITIWCENGIFFMRNGKLETCDAQGKRSTPSPDEMPAGNSPDANFINAILGKEPVGSPAIWGLRVIELTESAWKSVDENRVVGVDHVAV